MAKSKAGKTIHRGSLQARLSRLDERVRRLEGIVLPGWPHNIADGEKEIPGAGWVLPEECRPIYEGDWREFAKSCGLDPDNLVNEDPRGAWSQYFSKKALKEILRDVRGE